MSKSDTDLDTRRAEIRQKANDYRALRKEITRGGIFEEAGLNVGPPSLK